MTVSSARPAELDRFAAGSRRLDQELKERAATLRRLHASFKENNDWGIFDASSLLTGFDSYIEYNGNDASWVTNIADSFRRAGGDHALSTLPDAAIAASLRAAGLYGMRQAVTFDDPIAYGFPPTTGYANDPVNTASGNFVELEDDLSFGALAAGLGFSRTYNSRSDLVGPFGLGWASWASARLRPRAEGAEYEGPDGQRALIPRMGTGYGRIAGVQGLVEPQENGLLLRWFGGGTWEFDEAGLPAAIEWGPGTAIRFHHDDGRLTEMVHEGGKRIAFEWSDERIVGIACSDGRRVDYRYDAGGNLVEVDAESGTRLYELDENGRVARVVDGDGVVEVANTYDDDGRVAEQVSPFGRRTLFHYLPGRVTVNQDDVDGPNNTYIHDLSGRMIGLVDGHGNKFAKSYDEWGNPVSVTERNGATTVREWDDRARLVRGTRPGGEGFSYEYDDSDRVVRVEASTGAVMSYRYEGNERSPVEVVDPEGGVTRMDVNGGLVKRIVDPDGVEISFEFDRDGSIVAAVDGDGSRATIERDLAGRAVVLITPTGRRTEFVYDARGRLVERRDPGGATWSFEYSPAGRLTAVTDPMGGRRQTNYGDHGEVEEIADALGNVTSCRYDELGNLIGVLGPGGAKWEFVHDGLCRLTATHDPAGATWMREYDVTGNLVGMLDPTGVHHRASFDESGRVTKVSDGLTWTSVKYDSLGRIVLLGQPDGSETRATYDLAGRRTSVTDPSGGVTRFEYTPGGRMERIVSPLGRTTSFEYDRCGRVSARLEPGGGRWTYGYAPDGLLLEVAGPRGHWTRYSYDEASRLVERTSAEDGTTTYSYDLAGRVVEIASSRTGVSHFSYDAAGRVVGAVDANGGTTRYCYDGNGWLTEVEDPMGGRRTRDHDEVGRVITETDPLGRRTSYSYDPAGRLAERVDGAGLKTRWRYDLSGRVRAFGAGPEPDIQVEHDSLGRPVVIDEPGMRHELRWDPTGRLIERRRADSSIRWRYDLDGHRVALGYPDGNETLYRYDDAGQLVALEDPVAGILQLDRDPTGRVTALTAKGLRARWRYEGGNVVAYETETGEAHRQTRIERDEAGRATSIEIDGGVSSFSYDAAGQLVGAVTPEGRYAFGFDANGRLVDESSSEGDVTYRYDAAGQLLERRSRTSTTRYEYDGAGRRMRETTGERSRRYEWDHLGGLAGVETTGPEAERVTRTVVDALGELAQIDSTHVTWDTADPLSFACSLGPDRVISHGSPWALAGDEGLQWLQPDWMGSVGHAGLWGEAPSSEPQPRLGYRGELTLEGLVWLRNRAYDPTSRSFLSPDPLPPIAGTPWAGNPYAYAGNDPIGSLDPSGLRPVTEAELAAYREGMNRSWIGDRVEDWKTGVGIITSGAADWGQARFEDWKAGVATISSGASAWGRARFEDLKDDVGVIKDAGLAAAPRIVATVIRRSPIGVVLDQVARKTGHTVGVCLGGDATAGGDATGSVCYVATPTGESGLTVTVGAGTSMGPDVGYSALVGVTVSNADELEKLEGPFTYAEASMSGGWAGGGGSYAIGDDGTWQATGGWAPGAGGGGSVGVSNTWVYESF